LRFAEEETMSHNCDRHQEEESQPQPHHHACGNLFGCGEENGTGVLREDIKDAAFTRQAADRLLHMDEVNQAQLDGYLSARGRSRRRMLRASSFMGALATIGPLFTKLARAADSLGAGPAAVQKKKNRKARCTRSNRASRPCAWAFTTPTSRPS
jgi:hypothetical protein